MKITIEGTPEEVKELLQAIGSSKEQTMTIDTEKTAKHLHQAFEDIQNRLS